jgi:hypothetical protein
MKCNVLCTGSLQTKAGDGGRLCTDGSGAKSKFSKSELSSDDMLYQNSKHYAQTQGKR